MAQDPEPNGRGAFDHFLAWFDYDRERASEALTSFRQRLVRFFSSKGRHDDAEDLTDDVFVRASRKFACLLDVVKTEPQPFLFTVARFVCTEQRKERRPDQISEQFDVRDQEPSMDVLLADAERLRKIRESISAAEFEFLLRYYNCEPADKTLLAKEMGCTPVALRVRKYALIQKVLRELRKHAD